MPSNQSASVSVQSELTQRIIGTAMTVHSALAPGLLESAYEACLAFELSQNGLLVERQRQQPIVYRGLHVDQGYRIDLLVEGRIVVELKPQLLSYLRLASCEVGLLINFHVAHLRDGIRRVINTRIPASAPS